VSAVVPKSDLGKEVESDVGRESVPTVESESCCVPVALADDSIG